jgi:serine/threonine protein kinase
MSADCDDEHQSTTIRAIKKLSSGTFGDVFLMSDGTVGKLFVHDRETRESGVCRDGLKEIALLKGLVGEHVVAIRSVILDSGLLWCTMELATLGSLRTYINNHPASTAICSDQELAKHMVRQMFDALTFVHSRGVIHRDVKPENMLVFHDDECRCRLKISDFGSAMVHNNVKFRGEIHVENTDPITTIKYCAPEIAFGMNNAHTFAMDVWAAGLIVAEISMGTPPIFDNVSDYDDVVSMMCGMLGTPTRQNNLMPTYTFAHEFPHRAAQRGRSMIFTPPHLLPHCPAWAAKIMRGTIMLEPTKRETADFCSKLMRAEAMMPQHQFDHHCMTQISSSSSPPFARCPKTPKIHDDGGDAMMAVSIQRTIISNRKEMRRKIMCVMFDTCVCQKNRHVMDHQRVSEFPSSFDFAGPKCGGDKLVSAVFGCQREFHAAVKIFDRIMCMGYASRCVDDGSNEHYRKLVKCAAAVLSVASKLCNTLGIGPDWSSRMCEYAANKNSTRKDGKFSMMMGIAKFEWLRVDIVEREELKVLQMLEWDVWDVTVLDVPSPNIADHNVKLYHYVLCVMVIEIDTSDYVPHDMVTTAIFLSNSYMIPSNVVRQFPVHLMGLLEDSIHAVNAFVDSDSNVRRMFSSMCGATLDSRINIDFDSIHWI